MSEDRFDEFQVGDEAEISHLVSAGDVETFAGLTGDDNPLHMDEAYADTTTFGGRVVHGMLTASFISTIIGTKLPGPGALWYEQTLRYLSPVRIDERIRIRARVLRKSSGLRTLVLETIVLGGDGRTVIEGEAKVKVLPPTESKMTDGKKGTVIISGGSRGIGAAVAEELSGAGFPVVIGYASSESRAAAIRDGIGAAGGRAEIFRADVRMLDEIEALVRFADEVSGDVAGVVHCASPPPEGPAFEALEWEAVQEHLDVQVRGAFHLCKAVLPHLRERGRGSIVNIASVVADNVPPVGWLPYTLAKSALISFTRSLAAELGPPGIRVNCVSPGMTQTNLIAGLSEKSKLVAKMQAPLRRLATPEDVAGAVGFLFSEQAAHITGENLRVCGGASMV